MKRKIFAILFVLVLVLSISACEKSSKDVDSNEQEKVLVAIENSIIDRLESHVDIYYDGSDVAVDSLKIIFSEDESKFDAYGKVACIDKYGNKCKEKFIAEGQFWYVRNWINVDCRVHMTPLEK